MSKSGRRRGIVINLDNCGYGIVHRRAKALGWHIAKKGENWDLGDDFGMVYPTFHSVFFLLDGPQPGATQTPF